MSTKLDSSLGASLIGSYFAAILYGLTVLQAYHYFSRYWGRDEVYIYCLVLFVTLLDTLNQGMVMHSAWYTIVDNYCNVSALLVPSWTANWAVWVSEFIAFTVQTFYAYRLYKLSGKKLWWLSAVIFVLSLTTLIIYTIETVLLFKHGTYVYFKKVKYMTIMTFAFNLGNDVLITCSMTLLLMKHRLVAKMKQTENLIRRLISFTIYSGAVTTLVTMISLILATAHGSTSWDLILVLPLAKLYINSMLAFLNSRDSLREKHSDTAITVNFATGHNAPSQASRNETESTIPVPESFHLTTNVTTYAEQKP
ncbi:unnamed protein product [Cyclocybe aegerita]|uniref:DUF6534 domain-containing protein n=1 Tax=Cyclocybe aegerita TaxID=1973307 RepID=A0A8S0XQ79_CYCAE|nr:unnamed protein product [Cyclocybe aegerita]